MKGGGSGAGEGMHVSEPKFCSRVRCNTNVDVRVMLCESFIPKMQQQCAIQKLFKYFLFA